MSKVAIIGNAGGGKSVLARQLGRALGIPVFVIDDVQWQPGWRATPEHMVASAHARWLFEQKWIIDGWGSWEIIERRFEEADTIVIVDFPIWVHYRWALQRQLLAAFGLQRGWPPRGCRALPITLRLLKVMRYVNREMRPRLIDFVSEARFRDRVVFLRSPRELRAFKRRACELVRWQWKPSLSLRPQLILNLAKRGGYSRNTRRPWAWICVSRTSRTNLRIYATYTALRGGAFYSRVARTKSLGASAYARSMMTFVR